MPKITMIGRVADGLPLAASMADDKDAMGHELDSYERQAKKILRNLSKQRAADGGADGMGNLAGSMRQSAGQAAAAEPYVTVESGEHFSFHYIVDGGVCILTLTEKAYPRRLAYDYLDELRTEFLTVHGAQVATATRPYECIRFDTFIQKTKKLYSDSRTQRNLDKLNKDLRDVHSIVTKSITEVLGRGEKLEGKAPPARGLTRCTQAEILLYSDHRQEHTARVGEQGLRQARTTCE